MNLAGATVEATRTALIGKIGENLSIRRFARIAAQGKLTSYIHGGSKIGVLVDCNWWRRATWQGSGDAHRRFQAEIAGCIRGTAGLVDTERRIAIEKAKEAGKPEAMLEKIAAGTVQKYLKEVTLLGQLFVKDDKLSIEQLLKSKGAAVSSFALYIVAKAWKREKTTLAAEVAAQAAAAAAK